MEQPEMISAPVPPGSYEMNAPQYFATVAPEGPHHPAQHEYFAQHQGPPMPPPPLPEPPGTSNVSLDPMLQQPPSPSQAAPSQTQVQGSEAIINAAKAERTAQDRERGRLRVQRFRLKRKLADAEAGRRDKETLKKIKCPPPETLDHGNSAGPSSTRRVASVKDTEAELRERERGRLRVQAYRMRKKLAEAKDGLRDPGTLKKIRVAKPGENPTPTGPPNPPAYASPMPPSIQPMLYSPEVMFNLPVEAPPTMLPPPVPTRATVSETNAPNVSTSNSVQPPSSSQSATSTIIMTTTASPRQRAVRTNWFHPSRWSTINAAGLRANFSSAHEIVRLAKLAPGGEDTFKTLDRGTVHKWIDKERGGWSESVLEKVRKAALKEAESWDAGRATGSGVGMGMGESGELQRVGDVPGAGDLSAGYGEQAVGVEGPSQALGDTPNVGASMEINSGAGEQAEVMHLRGNP